MSTTGPQDSPTWPPQDRGDPPAPQYAPPAPPLPERRPRHPRRIAVAAAGVLLLAGVGTAYGVGGGHRVERHETLTHEIAALSIDAGSGDVTVRGGAAAGTVEVTTKTRAGWGSAPAGRETWQGNALALAAACSGACDIDFEVRVPDSVAVTAHTGSGDIDLNGSLGALSLEAGSGDVSADVTTTGLSTRTGSGDIDLRLRSAPTQLSANSGSGDVDVRLPSDQAYAVDSQTGSGDQKVEVQQQSTSGHRVQVRTGSGDIAVRAG